MRLNGSGCLLLLATGLMTGCGDDSATDADGMSDESADSMAAEGAHAGMMMNCGLQENCVGNLEFSHALMVEGSDGALSVQFVAGDPPTSTMPSWGIEVKDADGNTVTDATVTVSAWSVDCMHQGPTEPEEVTADSDGVYTIEPVFAHGGPWETRLAIEAGGDTDMVTVFFCVDAPGHGDPGVADHGAVGDAGETGHMGDEG